MLQVCHLSVGYGDRTLVRDISFELAPGEVVLLAGPNGTGKTTLLKALAGGTSKIPSSVKDLLGMTKGGHSDRQTYCQSEQQPNGHSDRQTYCQSDRQAYCQSEQQPNGHSDRQTYCQSEQQSNGHSDRQTCCQFEQQSHCHSEQQLHCHSERSEGIYPHTVLIPTNIPKVKGFTVKAFVETGCYRESDWRGRISKEVEGRMEEALRMLGMEELKGRDISTLSDGEFQKACLATGLTRQAEVLLLDEPTAHLDVENRIDVLRTLKDVARRTGTAILFSSHDLHDALQVADRVFVLTRDGRFLASDSADAGDEPGDGLLSSETGKAKAAVLRAAFPHLAGTAYLEVPGRTPKSSR